MSRHDELDFDSKVADQQSFTAKFWRFVKYLSTRRIECWGFFLAGYLIATIF